MPEPIDFFRNGVCSIGLLHVSLKKYHEDPLAHRLEVFGTGFLITDNLVITAAHVLDDMAEEQQMNEAIPDSQRFVDFTFARGKDQLHTTLRMIRNPRKVPDTSIDLTLIEIRREPIEHFAQIQPLQVQQSWDAHVMEKVYSVGFAHADLLLRGENGQRRFGPIIQQGYISAMAPFDEVTRPTEILLDLQAAHGMSGSPIISERTGKVIGVLYRIVKEFNILRQHFRTTTAFGIPITSAEVHRWTSIR